MNPIVVRIKQPSSGEVKIQMYLSSTVDQLLIKIRQEISESNDKNIRLIFMGKPLSPSCSTLGSFNINDNSIIHCFISPHRDQALSNVNANRNNNTNQILNALSGNYNNDNNNDEENNNSRHNNHNYRGFDRLLTVLNVNEVAAIRTSFRSDVDALAHRSDRIMIANDDNNNDNNNNNNSSSGSTRLESPEEFRFRMEDEWMSQQGPNSDYAQNLAVTIRNNMIYDNNSDDNNNNFHSIFGSSNGIFGMSSTQEGGFQEFLSGFFIGFVLGFIVLFCVWDRHISHRHRLGLLSGVLLSLSLDLSREHKSDYNKTNNNNHNNHNNIQNPSSSEVHTNIDAGTTSQRYLSSTTSSFTF